MNDELLPMVVLEMSDPDNFAARCNELLHQDYALMSSSCGFVNSEEYGFCGSYHAIFVHRTHTHKDLKRI